MISIASPTSQRARCHCGHVDFIYTPSPPHTVYICHCTSCRHFLGAALCLPLIIHLPPSTGAKWEPDERLLEELQAYVFSPRLTYYFCARCSCKVVVRIGEHMPDGRPVTLWGVMVGTLDVVEDCLIFEAHEHVTDTIDGGLADALSHYAGKPVSRYAHGLYDEKLPDSSEPWRWARKDLPSSQDESIDAYCKCGSVKFSLHRHDERRFPAQLCLCDTCRLTSGLEMAAWMDVPTTSIKTDRGSGDENLDLGSWTDLRTYAALPGCIRYNCSTCGAAVFVVSDDKPDEVRVAAGLLDAAEGARAETWAAWRTDGVGGGEDAFRRHPTLVQALNQGMK
ncbi:hypothetical protein ANO11243_064980 [Dothideomycetidae sp. 11243]|nr:hypothetical protein ANO11243_064980 [fungal sp. No.11243]